VPTVYEGPPVTYVPSAPQENIQADKPQNDE